MSSPGFKLYLTPWAHQDWFVHVVVPRARQADFLPFYFGALRHPEKESYCGQKPEAWLSADCSDTSELQGVDIFYLQVWVRLGFLCVCVCLCSICVKKLGHGVCKRGRSNYGRLSSANARPRCTRPAVFPNTVSCAASSVVMFRYATKCGALPPRWVSFILWPWSCCGSMISSWPDRSHHWRLFVGILKLSNSAVPITARNDICDLFYYIFCSMFAWQKYKKCCIVGTVFF